MNEVKDIKQDTPFEPRDDEVFFSYIDKDGESHNLCNENIALAKLLVDGVLFVGDFDSGPFFKTEERSTEATLCVWVNCNDLFMWASADAEDITEDELPELYNMHMADKEWGSLKWACKKRNMQPQAPIIRDMKKDGAWDDMMEALSKNE